MRDELSEDGIRRFLKHGELSLRVFPEIDSTNTALKALAAAGAPEGLALVAAAQSAGRGRMGRRFFSPAGSGLYLSLLLRPQLEAAEAVRLTACAAVAAAEAIEEFSGRPAAVKWVNDVLVDGRKVCGILTEGALDGESGRLRYAVIGVGVNLRAPEGGFPEELRGVAGAAFEGLSIPSLRCRLAGAILDRLVDRTADPGAPEVFEAYRGRSLVPGKKIRVLMPGAPPFPAEALALLEDYSLLVRLEDGSLRTLRAGEVSLQL